MSVIERDASEVGGDEPVGDAGFAAIRRLRQAAADVLAVAWAGRPGPVLGEALEALAVAERMVAAAKHEVLGAFDATGQHRVEGHPSAATWLAAKTKTNPRQVTHQTTVARALREMPLTEAAFAAGRIGAEHVAVLVRARTRDVVVEFAAAEADLVAAAEAKDFDEFDREVRDWRSFVQPDRSEKRARDAEQRREGHASRTFDGLVRLDAWLDPLGGTEFLDELGRIEQELFEADWAEARARVGEHATARDLRRTAPQRRADPLVEMARRSQAHGQTAGGPRWVLNVMMGWHTFCAEAAATLADLTRCTGALSTALAQRLGLEPAAEPTGPCPTCGFGPRPTSPPSAPAPPPDSGSTDDADPCADPPPEPHAGPPLEPPAEPPPEPYAGPPPTRRHTTLPDGGTPSTPSPPASATSEPTRPASSRTTPPSRPRRRSGSASPARSAAWCSARTARCSTSAQRAPTPPGRFVKPSASATAPVATPAASFPAATVRSTTSSPAAPVAPLPSQPPLRMRRRQPPQGHRPTPRGPTRQPPLSRSSPAPGSETAPGSRFDDQGRSDREPGPWRESVGLRRRIRRRRR